MFKKSLCSIISIIFLFTTLTPVHKAQAQSLLGLPEPGTMVSLSAAYQPAILKGITVHKDNPFMFDFLVDVGQDNLTGDSLKNEGDKLIKYFMATLAVPEKDLWVNLSPYEKDRTVPEALGQTDMGRDLLAQDYILKQLTASLIYPEKELGKKFWDNVYQKTQAKYGNVNIPVNTFNKVWIMADRAEVFERNQTAFVTASHLKVLLETDYLALQKSEDSKSILRSPTQKQLGEAGSSQNEIAKKVIREIILPELEHEINTGKNFANLRQIFNSIILASWYKNNLKQSLLNETYSNKSTVKGIDIDDKTIKQQIYERYLQAYKKGVFNYIKETPEGAPKKYFSGGVLGSLKITKANEAMAAAAFNENNKLANFHVKFDAAMLNVAEIKALTNELLRVTVNNKNITLLNGFNSLGGNVMVSPDNEGGFYIILSVDWEKNVVNHDGAAATTPNPAFHPVNREKIEAAINVFIKNFLKDHRDTYSIESLRFISPEVKPGQLRMDIHRIHITSPFVEPSDAAMQADHIKNVVEKLGDLVAEPGVNIFVRQTSEGIEVHFPAGSFDAAQVSELQDLIAKMQSIKFKVSEEGYHFIAPAAKSLAFIAVITVLVYNMYQQTKAENKRAREAYAAKLADQKRIAAEREATLRKSAHEALMMLALIIEGADFDQVMLHVKAIANSFKSNPYIIEELERLDKEVFLNDGAHREKWNLLYHAMMEIISPLSVGEVPSEDFVGLRNEIAAFLRTSGHSSDVTVQRVQRQYKALTSLMKFDVGPFWNPGAPVFYRYAISMSEMENNGLSDKNKPYFLELFKKFDLKVVTLGGKEYLVPQQWYRSFGSETQRMIYLDKKLLLVRLYLRKVFNKLNDSIESGSNKRINLKNIELDAAMQALDTNVLSGSSVFKRFDILVQIKTAVNAVLKGQRYFLDTQYSKDDVEQLINAYNGQALDVNKVALLSEASDSHKTNVLYLSSSNDALRKWVDQELKEIRIKYIANRLKSRDLQNVEDALFGVDGVEQVTEQAGSIVEDAKERFLNIETGEFLTADQVLTQLKNYRWFVVGLEGGEILNIVEPRLAAMKPGIQSIQDALGVQLKVRMGEGFVKLTDGLKSLGKVDVISKPEGGFLVTIVMDHRPYEDPLKFYAEAVAAFIAQFTYNFRQYYTAEVKSYERRVLARDGSKRMYQIVIDPVTSNADAAMKSVMVSKRDFQSFHEYLDKLLKKELQVESYKIAGETVVVIPVSFMPDNVLEYMEAIADKFNVRLQRLNNASYYFVPNRLRYFLGTTNGNAEYMGRKIAPLTKYLNALNAELTANINHKFNPPIDLNGIHIDAAMSHYVDSRQELLLRGGIAKISKAVGYEVQSTTLSDVKNGYVLSIATPTREESKAVLDKLLAYATNEDVKNNYVIELLRVPQEVEFMGSKYFNVMFKLTLKTSGPEADKDDSNVISFNANKTKADAAMNGGIDLKDAAANTNVRKEGQGVEFVVDQALIERVRREGINSLTPVILRIDSSVNIWPLLGLKNP